MERAATSIGANIREANYAYGKADFIAKLQIALKECYETEYWLELFVKADIIGREAATDIYNDCGSIRRMLIASINTAKENNYGYYKHYALAYEGVNEETARWLIEYGI